jgi:lysophospholipase L1-like esterase
MPAAEPAGIFFTWKCFSESPQNNCLSELIVLTNSLLRPPASLLSAGLCASLLLPVTQAPLAAQQAPAERRPGTKVRIELVGDSTQTDIAGYGRGFCANLTADVDCVNMAHGGASTKTYREDGYWARALASKPDYMLIQFGHNDMESSDHLPRQTTMAEYEENLRRFVSEARAAGVQPVLVTPLTRRYFGPDGKIHSDLLAHAATMKRVAGSMQVPLVDLQADSIAYLDRIGPVEGSKLGITKKAPDGSTTPDKTHLNWEGSYVFGRIVAVGLVKAVPSLAGYLRPQPAVLPEEGQLAMRVLNQAPFRIVLVGDSTVATEGGWGPGFCATVTPNVTCIDLAANGRSSKSYLDEGLWRKALAEKAQYYFIQFGHNDQKPDPARHTDPQTSYKENLRLYIRDTRAAGAIPVLVTPLSRRNYKDGILVQDGLDEYAAAMRQVAAEEKVALVDLYAMSRTLLETLTQQQADAFDAVHHPDGVAENHGSTGPDRTHLNDLGKKTFGRMVADSVIRTEVELGPDIQGLPAGKNPATVPLQAASAGNR